MVDKRRDLADKLSIQSTPPEIRRGQGLRLSTETPALTQESENAETQKRRNAETHGGPVRVNRGYALREDLVKGLKRLALEQDRKLYEVMEDALEAYLRHHTEGSE